MSNLDFSAVGLTPDQVEKAPTGVLKLTEKALGRQLEGVEFVVKDTPLPALFKSLSPHESLGEGLFKLSSPRYSTGTLTDDNKSGIQYDPYTGAPRSVRDHRHGIIWHPFDMELAIQMRTVNPYHATCIDKLSELIVGDGFVNEKAMTLLDEVTEHGAVHFLLRFVKQLVSCGNSPIEIIRYGYDPSEKIAQLDVLRPYKVSKVLPSQDRNLSYLLWEPHTHYSGYGSRRSYRGLSDADMTKRAGFAPVGMREQVLQALKDKGYSGISIDEKLMGEGAMLISPSEQWDHYGCPQWIGAHSYLELSRIHMQRAHDYFFNRGTPDTVTFIYGIRLAPKERAKIQQSLNIGVGPGFGRSTVVFMPNSSAKTGKVQVEKFGDSIDGASFSALHDVYALGTCAAHGVKPNIAGIPTSRSLGGANETLQDLVLLQMTRIDLEQEMLRSFLFKHVQPYLQGAPKLDRNFFKIKPKIDVSQSDLAAMNSVARQRQSSLGPTTSDNGLQRN